MVISVLLPVKNAEDLIERAVHSILDQTIADFELIVINDFSTDQTISKLSSLNDSRIRIIDNRGSGIAAALNSGLEKARGEFIARMDADDIAHPDRLHKQLNFAREHQSYDVISCRVTYRAEQQPEQAGYKRFTDWTNRLLNPLDHYTNRFVDTTIAHPTLFCRKELFEQYGSYDESGVPEDFELWLRWMEKGLKFAKLNDVLYTWTDQPNRLSRINQAYSEAKFFEIKSRYFSRWWLGCKIRELWIWGYGSDVFRKSRPLIAYGVNVKGYIDIKMRPEASRKVIHYQLIEQLANPFILVYVSDRSGKEMILDYFSSRRLIAGKDYLFMV